MITITIFYFCLLCNQGSKPRADRSALHGSHDLIEENPIGQPHVASTRALGHRVHLHVLAVERNNVLPPHQLLEQRNLWQQKQQQNNKKRAFSSEISDTKGEV